MKFSFALVLLATITWAAVNGPCSSGPGVCISTSSCHAGGGTSTRKLCPNDPDDIHQVAVHDLPWSGRRAGSLQRRSLTQIWVGLCPGPSNFKCC
ncbi:hypothetical protein C8R45DRAFT_804608, partial [Mycena sanguinolenta]